MIMDDSIYDMIKELHTEVTDIMEDASMKRDLLSKVLPHDLAELALYDCSKQSPIQRYDVIIDIDWWYHVVELNSETPAWTPETINSYLFFDTDMWPYYNDNSFFESHLENSIQKWYDILYLDDSKEYKWEDYTNALYLASITWWNMIDVRSIEFDGDNVISEWHVIKKCYTFYPMERIMEDEWWKKLRELYEKWKITIWNWPKNLIPQSKAFWALARNMPDNDVIKKYVPEYSFHKKEWFISKAILSREWVWIWNDADWSVYQKKIEQKVFEIDWKKWYITIWVYINWDGEIMWTYNRFCENAITDSTAYYLPTFNKIQWEN